MSRKSPSSFLQEELELLVQHFGAERVRNALSKVTSELFQASPAKSRAHVGTARSKAAQSITSQLEECRRKDPSKYDVLRDFYTALKDRRLLPEAQDIRHFAQAVGLKDIRGKSRKDMVPQLMRFLLAQPIEQLKIDVETAAGVSEQQRRQGFSVLADKLLSR